MGRIAVGTSGWSYDHWAGRFYPDGLARPRWLAHYAARYPTVEVNATFYRLPRPATVESWRTAVPAGFRFAVKGSRYITHRLRLRDAGGPVDRFVEAVRPLGDTLAVVLWQLPPDLTVDVSLLTAFLACLPGDVGHAVEVRHPSWIGEEVFATLAEHGTAWVAVSAPGLPAVRRRTAPFVYARFHGLTARYAHRYTADELAPWAEWLAGESAAGAEGFCYFNNDAEAAAPADAGRLVTLLGDVTVPWPP